MAVAERTARRSQAQRALRKSLPPHAKVHLGCGRNHFDGWVNIDVDRAVKPDVRIDLRGGFPAPSSSVHFIYSEHVFEHLTLDDGRRVFLDCYEALQDGGVMRIAMPDLRYIVERYLDGRLDLDEVPEAAGDRGFESIDSAAMLLNFALRSWGHLYLYDLEELSLRLAQAGFRQVVPRGLGESCHPELVGLEGRGQSRLVVEATR